jgi:regulatory protein
LVRAPKTLSLRARALAYLARREHSRFELETKLGPHDTPEAIALVLDDFERRNWLSAERFAEQFVNSRLSRFGTQKIRYELAGHQLPEALCSEVLKVAQASEYERALAAWKRRFGGKEPDHDLDWPGQQRERMKQYRFLAQRGFSGAIIGKIVRDLPQD